MYLEKLRDAAIAKKLISFKCIRLNVEVYPNFFKAVTTVTVDWFTPGEDYYKVELSGPYAELNARQIFLMYNDHPSILGAIL